ncbi:Uncharacterized protein APZ42_031810 [Daphnia magna]|uniref:Uncharacterized protein n=1 Tax=Daphnia magna TaxID=35525 RepID=A0A0P6CWH9_9CRUS|nr:Uncharacterized protein APZ42_031810 [Daphnia magna]
MFKNISKCGFCVSQVVDFCKRMDNHLIVRRLLFRFLPLFHFFRFMVFRCFYVIHHCSPLRNELNLPSVYISQPNVVYCHIDYVDV